MKVKRSKDLISGAKLEPMTIEPYYVDPKNIIQIKVPNRYSYGRGYSSVAITKKEARRLASALLEFTKSLE